MFPATPPNIDLSRPQLRQLAAWIRDDLDPVVAREGPEKLRADDVLTLHELFQALRTSRTTTSLDLRATGIHRAVLEVAGTATRWPGRLVDDCDRVILVWTGKFGRLEDLRPFMYGRGGRLEGIASAGEFSRTALLKRWQSSCPEKIVSKKSRRHGNLGFKAGDWWVNPLFAHHAGIIDIESTEGGVCYDKHGAYAIVLKDSGEIDAPTESRFTYRPQQNDKGKFRLTAADARSRLPIRVLRCHSLNSIWGPKAGIRYEGLYRTASWTVLTTKSDDVVGRTYKAGDIVFEIKMERIDDVPMQEVMKHPTSHELDDYTEYKRLKSLVRVHREEHRKGPIAQLDTTNAAATAKVAPPIPSPGLITSHLRPPLYISPAPSRSTTFRDPVATIAVLKQPHSSLNLSKISPASSRSSPIVATLPTNDNLSSSLDLSNSTLGVPTVVSGRPGTLYGGNDSLQSAPIIPLQKAKDPSVTTSKNSGQSHHSDIREIVPWIDYDLELVTGAPSISTRPGRQHEAVAVHVDEAEIRLGKRKKRSSRNASMVLESSSPSPENDEHQMRSVEGRTKTLRTAHSRKDDTQKSVIGSLSRGRNPLAKIFASTEDGATDEGEDYFSYKAGRRVSFSTKPSSPMIGACTRASSSNSLPLSPVPIRPASPTSALITNRRDACVLSGKVDQTPSAETSPACFLVKFNEGMTLTTSRPQIVFKDPFEQLESGIALRSKGSESVESLAPETRLNGAS